jgi:glycosyltransferase involved in cell wall biosynthesis
VAIAEFNKRLQASISSAPNLQIAVDRADYQISPTISVIIPAYNEEINIYDCTQAVLNSNLDASAQLEVWIADDRSTDRTAAIAQALAQKDSRVKVLTVPPRPVDIVWRGKNWACTQAAALATAEYLLFIDADVRLEPLAIAAAIQEAITKDTDLLSCAPLIVCGCFAEWLVQPLMMSAIAVGFNFDAVNDPVNPTAFAAGMFMLLKRSSYEKIGGHREVGSELVEDVELGRLVKGSGLKLRFMLGIDLIKVRMYQSFGTLWEGWTKNFYMGSRKDFFGTLYACMVMSLVYIVPWLGGSIGIILLATDGIRILALSILLLSMVAIAMQYNLRQTSAESFKQPLRYWWLTWLSGGLIVAIAITSIIKTETGWGWTWRGRSLAIPKAPKV